MSRAPVGAKSRVIAPLPPPPIITNTAVSTYRYIFFILAVLILVSQCLIALYFDMNNDFMTEIREQGLGWTEMTPYNEFYSDGYFVTWGCFGCCLLNMILSLLMHAHDKEYIKYVKLEVTKSKMHNIINTVH